MRIRARTISPERSLPVKGSEPLAAGTGCAGTATGALPPAVEGALARGLGNLWPCVRTGLGRPLEPLVEDEDGPPPEPDVPGGGCCGYWSAAACRKSGK